MNFDRINIGSPDLLSMDPEMRLDMKMMFLMLAALILAGGCSDDECDPNPSDPTQFVIVGFYTNSDCSGDPIATNAFPVTIDSPCYCWPGNSGENSADTFICDPDNRTFTYTQYNSLTCGEDDNTPTVKTVSETCAQDIPPTLHSKIIDFGACAPQ